MTKLAHKYGGTYTTLGAYLFKAPAPLDTRSVVETIGHLISEDVWKNQDYTAFNGLQVYVESTQELYILKDSSGLESDLQPESYFTGTTNKAGEVITPPATSDDIQTKVDLYWQKLASASDISGLSGVFQFKGMAYAISPDSSYILLNNDTFDLTPIGTACDMIGNTYFGWSIDSTEIWTAGPLWENAVKYTKSETSTPVYGMTIDGTLYFVSSTQPKPDAGILLESLDGRYVFFDKWLGSLESAFTGFNPIGVPICDQEGTCTDTIVSGYIFKYDAYTFTEAEVQANISFYVAPLLASDGTKTDGDGNKIPNNSGYVYQIGENEYASNGQIWVKLGSPVEDWIII